MGEWTRGVSPVIGVIVMVVLVLLLASVFATGALRFGDDLSDPSFSTDNDSALSGNPWSGNREDLVRLSDTRAGATDVSYRVNFTVEEGSDTIGNSLNSVYLEVTTEPKPDLFSETERADLVRVGIDENSTGSIDREITGDVDDWTVENGGAALKIGFSGSAYTASANDSVIVVFEGAKNPDSPGEYDLRAETSGDGNTHYGTITITESGGASVTWAASPHPPTVVLREARGPAVTAERRRGSRPHRPRFADRRAVEA
jgi:flagellin-like protein